MKKINPKLIRLFSIMCISALITLSGSSFAQNVSVNISDNGFAAAEKSGGKTHVKIVKVKSATRYKIGQDQEIKAVFEGLKPEALELGLNDAILFGKPERVEVPGGKSRIKINWHTISTQAAKTASMSERLKTPLKSQFLVKSSEKNIEPGTVIPAKGNFESLTETFLAMKEKIEKKESVEVAAAESGTESDKATRDSNAFSPGGNAAGIPTGSSPTSGGDYETNLITTTWEECYPRIAELEEKLYLRHREIKTNQDGSSNSIGECIDSGQTITAQKIWGEVDAKCPNIHDWANKKTYFQYKAVATYNDQEILVRGCTNDETSSTDILASTGNCNWRHDFNDNYSTQQEELFFMMGPNQYFITSCQDGPEKYDHYRTTTTCEPYIDELENLFFPQSRIAYTLPDDTIGFATKCRVDDGNGYAIVEEFCDPKYEHDFAGGNSYYVTHDTYIDGDGVKKALNACSRSGQASFPHLINNDVCAIVNDDVAMNTVVNGTLYIESPDDGQIELQPCHQIGNPIAYVRKDEFTEVEFTASSPFIVPDGVNEVFVTLVGAGANGQAGGTGSNRYSRDVANGFLPGNDGGNGGAGGNAGEVKDNVRVPVLQNASVPITVGTSNGQNSSFGSLLIASGGFGFTGSGGAGGKPNYVPSDWELGIDGICTNEHGGAGGVGAGSNFGGSPGSGGSAGGYNTSTNPNYPCVNGGGGGGGGGGNAGYGTAVSAGNGGAGVSSTHTHTGYPGYPGAGGSGGKGYGAGGGGGAGAGGGIGGNVPEYVGTGGAGGAGASGYAKLGFSATSYIRGDGSIFIPTP